jgi:tRNA threonylcarbamoyladenosine biosynthesis protein TsaE
LPPVKVHRPASSSAFSRSLGTLDQMEEVELVSESANATQRAAAELAADLRPGDVILITGDVGTGKTTFVRAACRELGVRETVASPSFTIGRTYRGTVPVSHLDLFRLDTLAEEDPGLLEEYFTPESVVFIEWPRAAEPELEARRVVVRLRLVHLGGDRRGISVSGHADERSPWSSRFLRVSKNRNHS